MSYLAHVREFLPAARGAELEQREALLKTRDWAAAMRGRTASERAFSLVCEAHEIAGAVVFDASETPDRLALTVNFCRHLIGAALIAEDLDEGAPR